MPLPKLEAFSKQGCVIKLSDVDPREGRAANSEACGRAKWPHGQRGLRCTQ